MILCVNCNSEIKTPKKGLEKRKFCNRKCAAISNKTWDKRKKTSCIINCFLCNKSFNIIQSRKRIINFCSEICYKKHKSNTKNTKEEKYILLKQWRVKNEIKLEKQKKEYYIKNKDRIALLSKINFQKNKHKKYKTVNQRRKTDVIFKLSSLFRSKAGYCFKMIKQKKIINTKDLLGIDYFELKIYIENQFKKGMTWKNHGSKWHIDHKIPLSSAKTKEELIILFHYRNLQPLWKEDNLIKSDKILPIQVYLPI